MTKEELFDQFLSSVEEYGSLCYHEGTSWGYNSYVEERSKVVANIIQVFHQALEYQSDIQSVSN